MTTQTVRASAAIPLRAGGRALDPPRSVPVPAGRSRARLYLVSRRIGVAAVALLLLGAVLAPSAVAGAAVVLAVGGALFGLPHGAVDHVVPRWLARGRPGAPSLAATLAGYLALVGVGAAALRLAPTITLVVFLAVAGWHFGRGEVATSAEAAGRPVPGPRGDLLPTLAHGLVTVVLPLAAHPHVSRAVLAVLAADLPTPVPWLRPLALIGTLLVVATAALRLLRAGRAGEAGELLLLTCAFAVVHPFAAFGVYFGLWHAPRHTARLVDLAAGAEPLWIGARRFAMHALLPTIGALGVLAGVWLTARRAPASGGSGLLAAELATLAALTFPHAGVVLVLDRVRGRAAGVAVSGG